MGSSHQNIKELFDKLMSKELDFSEKEELRTYIQSTYKDKELDGLLQNHWNQTENKLIGENQFILNNIKTKLLDHINHDDAKVVRLNRNRFSKVGQYALRIAAILFIPLMVYSAYLYYNLNYNTSEQLVMQEVSSNPGSRVHFVLPDSTEVWLNSESKLEFPSGFGTQKLREVKLYGQAYFKVSHDKAHPFIVNTNSLNIKVLGTSFDVSAYEDDLYFTSTLEEGKIMVQDQSGKELSVLNPGEELRLDRRNNKFNIEHINTKLNTSWKDGYLVFKETPINEVVQKLERWYNCNINLSSDLEHTEYQYTATIKDETLGEVLQMLELSTSIKTRIQDREVTIWAK